MEDYRLLTEELKMALERKRKSREEYLEEERLRIRGRLAEGWARSLAHLEREVVQLRHRRLPHGRRDRREEI